MKVNGSRKPDKNPVGITGFLNLLIRQIQSVLSLHRPKEHQEGFVVGMGQCWMKRVNQQRRSSVHQTIDHQMIFCSALSMELIGRMHTTAFVSVYLPP